jgi:hypothetical protein
MSELAEALREIVESADAMQKARAALPEGYELWSASRARDYLRGYDDAKQEMDPYIEKLERGNEEFDMRNRELMDELTNANARVRELEAALLDEHSRLAQEEAQPAAVGVVGALLGHSVLNGYDVLVTTMLCSQAEALRIARQPGDRVVAIVDPAQIVELASGEPLNRCVDSDGLLYWKADYSVRADAKLYVGAQPAQERDG